MKYDGDETIPRGAPLPKPGSYRDPNFLWRALGLAAVGQIFLAHAGQAWTLFPGLLLFACAVALVYPSLTEPGKEPRPLSAGWEWALFALVLLTAFFLRIYDIDSLPAGMHTDQGLTGLCALRILHEGWRPFGEVFDYQVPELLLFYQLAAWFGLVGSSYFTFHLFFILLSLAAFPFVYWTIRQWAGQRTALLSLFILAVMRWNWIETRNGYPSIQVPFYLLGALAFWAYWGRSGKRWAFALASLFAGVGFYSYQAFKIAPLLFAICAVYEYRKELTASPPLEKGGRGGISLTGNKKKLTPPSSPSFRGGKGVRPFLVYFLAVFILILPWLTVMAQRGVLGHREADLFIGAKIAQEHSLKPLWDVWTGTLLMFNRAGDENPRHNIPGHRMLDDVTAVFFVLGLALAWRRRKGWEGFYPLAGFGVMLLTGLLSTDPAHSNRLVSLTPFVAYFAGSAFDFLWNHAKTVFKKPFAPTLGGTLLLAVLAAQNIHTYFVEQAENPECQTAFGPEQTFIGRNIEASWADFPGQNRYFITPSYFQNHTVDFLSYPARSNVSELELGAWASGNIPEDKPVNLYLESEKPGVIEFIKTLYPEASQASYPPWPKPPGMKLLYFYPKDRTGPQPWIQGLKGEYFNSADWNAKPVAFQRDPVLNFTSKFDFPFTNFPPFRIRWTGTLEAPRAGDYQFQVLTTDSAQLWLDGRPVPLEKPLRLPAGSHRLRLDFEKDSGDSLALTLVWKKPGDEKWEVVPATAFGKITPGPNSKF